MGKVGESEPNTVRTMIYITSIIRAGWKTGLRGFVSIVVVGIVIVFLTLHPKYLSRTVLPLSPNVRVLIKTEAILDPVVATARLDMKWSGTEAARRRLASQIDISQELITGSGLYALTVSDETPQRAQNILQELLAKVLVASKPTGTARANALQEIERFKRSLGDLNALAQTLKENANRVKEGSDGEQYARALVALVTDIAAKENRISELQNWLEGLQPADVVLQPTLATLPESTNLLTKLSIVLIGAFLFMLGFLLLRHQWRQEHSSI
jgi:hypothetical protein